MLNKQKTNLQESPFLILLTLFLIIEMDEQMKQCTAFCINVSELSYHKVKRPFESYEARPYICSYISEEYIVEDEI